MQTRLGNKPVFPGNVYDIPEHVDISNALNNGILELVEPPKAEKEKASKEKVTKIQKKDIGQQVPVDTGPSDADETIKAIVEEAEDFDFLEENDKK